MQVKDRYLQEQQQEIVIKNEQMAAKDREIAIKDREIAIKDEEIAEQRATNHQLQVSRDS